PAPTAGDVLQGAQFYVAGAQSPAGQAQAQYAQSNPAWAQALGVIAGQPGTYRFSPANGPDIAGVVSHYLLDAAVSDPGTVPLISTYYLVDGHCGGWSDPPAAVAAYQSWISGLASGIGNFRAVLFLEMDSLITSGCLSPQGLNVRLSDELAYAVGVLERDPHLVVYLDGGSADAVPWRQTARMLAQADVAQAQGFFLNSTHFDWTTSELYYGQRIARALGGVHFVVNTGEGGRGPLIPRDRARDGNEVLCNPPGRGLGPLTTSTGYLWADAFLWTSNPGESGGACVPGAPPTAAYWPAYAVMLVDNATDKVTGPAYPLITSDGTVLHVARRGKRRVRDTRPHQRRHAHR
ncbi:MAG: glycoside hydrolase family 6 protein, partial [Solirubrobacteraceae bacterium]